MTKPSTWAIRVAIMSFAVILFTPAGASAQGEPPSQEELDTLAAEFECPALTGLDVDSPTGQVSGSDLTVYCRYTGEGVFGNTNVSVSWQPIGTENPTLCQRASSTTDDEQFDNILGNVRVPDVAVLGRFNLFRDTPVPPVADFEAAAAMLADQAADRAASCPPPVECTRLVGGFSVVFDTEADLFLEGGVWTANCWWSAGRESEIPEGERGLWSDVVLDVSFVTGDRDGAQVTTVCSTEPFDRYGTVIIPDENGLAISARLDFRNPALRFPRDEMIVEAKRIMALVAPDARSCDGIEIIPRSSYYTPLPAWLDIDPALALGGAPIEIDTNGGGANGLTAAENGAVVTGTATAPAPSAFAGNSEGGGSTLLSVLGVVMLVVSVLGILLSLVLVGRESRLRPVFDVLRVVVMATVAAAMTFVFATETPLWAFAAALVSGLVLGTLQGRNLVVRQTAKGLYARRATVAVLAFVAGLVVTQIAGLMNRAGAIQFGLALTVLSVATSVGLIAGRHPGVGEARRLGATAAALFLLAPVIAVLTFGPDRASAQDDPAPAPIEEPRDLFLDLVDWETVEIIGGFAASPAKPPISFPVLDQFATPPADLVVTNTWDETDETDETSTLTFDLEETYSFSLTTSGICCDASYAVTGTSTLTGEGLEPVTDGISATATVSDLVIGGGASDPMPFGQATIFEDTCRRTIAAPAEEGDRIPFDSFLINGSESRGNMITPKLWIDCDVPGFTVEAALAAAPPPPAADDPARIDEGFGAVPPGCPVYQETVAALYDPSFEDGKLNPSHLGKLFLDPNQPACRGAVDLGGDERGGTRSELSYALATADPVTEAFRRWDKWDSYLLERPLHEIPEDQRCILDANDLPQNPETTDACLYRSYHKVAEGEITIWVDRSEADGPNTLVRGFFPWGDFKYRCHYCEPGSPEIARIIDRMNEFGARGVGNYDPADLATPPPPSDDAEEQAVDEQEVDEALVDLFAGDDADDETRAAVAAALVGLLGAASLTGISLLESGNSAAELIDALRSGDLDGLRPGELPTDGELATLFDDPAAAADFAAELRRRQQGAGLSPGAVIDERGTVLLPDEDGRFVWETSDTSERLTREEILERIADARAADAAAAARHEAIVAEQYDDDKMQERFDDLSRAGVADDEQAAADLAADLDHEAAQDETRQRVADTLQDRAETGGWDTIATRLEQGDSLSREELQAIRDALGRLTAEQGAFDPAQAGSYAEDLWNEFAADAATGQEVLARVADSTYGPAAGWIVRNPGTTARIGLGVATGGFSEGVIAPHEMMEAMERAADQAHAEGRDLTYSEAVLAAAWQAGPGMLMGHAAELGISAAGPTITRWGGEALESMGRAVDEFFDSARGSIDDGAEIATRSVRGSAELADAHGLRWNPEEAAGGVRSTDPGTIIPQTRIAEDYGMAEPSYRQLRGAAQRNDVTIRVRSRSRGAMERIEAGAVPKPEDIKIKTGGELDQYIGMDPSRRDLVPWKPDGDWIPPTREAPPANWPEGRAWDDEAYDSVMGRYRQRRQEFLDNKDKINQLFSDGRARHNAETGDLEWNTTDGRRTDPGDFRPVGGDHDVFDVEVNVPAEVRAMGGDEVERYVRQVQTEVIQDLSGPPLGAQHGAHMQWSVPSTRQAQEINVRILDGHRQPLPGKSGDALLTISRDMPAHVSYYQGASLTLDEVRRVFPS